MTLQLLGAGGWGGGRGRAPLFVVHTELDKNRLGTCICSAFHYEDLVKTKNLVKVCKKSMEKA